MAERVKSWKAWGVMTTTGHLCHRGTGYGRDNWSVLVYLKRFAAERFVRSTTNPDAVRIVRVTITVDETKKKKGKVKR